MSAIHFQAGIERSKVHVVAAILRLYGDFVACGGGGVSSRRAAVR